MPAVSLWTKVAIAIQSALSASQVVSAITKASTGVLTYVGADPSNGDYILLTVAGMHQVNNRIFRVANVNAGGNTLELEGEATTDYDTFTSGSMEIITFGTSLATATTLSASGGEFEFEDTTTIHAGSRSQIPTLPAPAVYSFDNIWDVADAGLVALKAASVLRTKRAIRITFSNGQKVLFTGYIGATLLPVGSAPGKVTTPCSISMDGLPTVYSS